MVGFDHRQKSIDVICQHKQDGNIIPLKIRLQDEDGEYQAFVVKSYRRSIRGALLSSRSSARFSHSAANDSSEFPIVFLKACGKYLERNTDKSSRNTLILLSYYLFLCRAHTTHIRYRLRQTRLGSRVDLMLFPKKLSMSIYLDSLD